MQVVRRWIGFPESRGRRSGQHSVRVDANAYRVVGAPQRSGLYVIPDDAQQRAALVERILSDTLSETRMIRDERDFEGCSNTGG